MTEIYAALIGVAGTLALAYLQRRWERRSIGNQWERQAKELDERLERAHAEQLSDLRAQLRAKDKQIAALSGRANDQ